MIQRRRVLAEFGIVALTIAALSFLVYPTLWVFVASLKTLR